MATNVVKTDLSGAVNAWLDEALKSGTAHKLSVHAKTGYVALRSGTTEWDIQMKDAAVMVASKLYDLAVAKDGRIQSKSYSANKYYLKLAGVAPSAFGPDEKAIQERDYTPRTAGASATVGTGKSAVAKIDSQIKNLQERQAKLEVTLTETKAAIKKLQDERPAAVKAEEDAKAEAGRKATEERIAALRAKAAEQAAEAARLEAELLAAVSGTPA